VDEIKSYLKEMDLKTGLVVIGGIVLITLWAYQGHHAFFAAHMPGLAANPNLNFYEFAYMNGAAFALWFVIPIILIKFPLKEKAKDFGFGLGDWKFGLKFLLLGMVVMIVPLYFTGKNPEFNTEYPLSRLAGKSLGWFLFWESSYLTYYIGFEFLFRGFMLFGLRARIGAWMAIAFETTVSTLIHIGMTAHQVNGLIFVGKPEGETISAIVAGLVFGAVALRTRSFIWPLGLHWFVGIFTDFFSLYHSGRMWP
jgi:membrane protease YdiL (CAAX protease family)